MKYDELDDWAEQQFSREVLDGDVILSGGRVSNIDQVIDDAYRDVMDWHNARISAGTNPESGLHGLPHIPWDEKIDGMAAMHGNGSVGDAVAGAGAQWIRVNGEWVNPRYVSPAEYKGLSRTDRGLFGALSCALFILFLVVVAGLALLVTMEG
jgi:hypothetical protein